MIPLRQDRAHGRSRTERLPNFPIATQKKPSPEAAGSMTFSFLLLPK
jgi:hypothetical protein